MNQMHWEKKIEGVKSWFQTISSNQDLNQHTERSLVRLTGQYFGTAVSFRKVNAFGFVTIGFTQSKLQPLCKLYSHQAGDVLPPSHDAARPKLEPGRATGTSAVNSRWQMCQSMKWHCQQDEGFRCKTQVMVGQVLPCPLHLSQGRLNKTDKAFYPISNKTTTKKPPSGHENPCSWFSRERKCPSVAVTALRSSAPGET